MREPEEFRADAHPADESLIALIDGAAADEETKEHLAACEVCRRRRAELEGVVQALGADPPMPDDAAFAVQREAILASLPDRRRPPAIARALRRPAWWGAALAAAALAGVILLGERGGNEPSADRVPALARGEEAAEAVYLAAAGDIPEGEEVALAEAGLESLAAVEETTIGPAAASDPIVESVELSEEFAALDEENQRAILAELETATFDL